MFDKIGDLPLHPLVVHAAVIGVPLAALLALLFAFPKTREWARWPLAITVIGATAVTFVARESGLALEAALGIKPGNPVGDLILQHSQLANQLFYIMIGLAVVSLDELFHDLTFRQRGAWGGRDRRAAGSEAPHDRLAHALGPASV